MLYVSQRLKMKSKHIIVTTILFSFSLFFDIRISDAADSINTRKISSQKNKRDCISLFENYAYGKSKAKRLRQLANSRKNLNFERYTQLLINSHDNTEIKKGENPKGFSESKANAIYHFTKRTNSNYVTAYYQHYEAEEYGTWGVFDFVTKGENLNSDEGELVYKNLMLWYDNYSSYRQRLSEQVAKSFESQMRYTRIKEHFENNKESIKSFNFRNGNRYYLDLPVAVKDNATEKWEMHTERQGFSNARNLDRFIRDLKVEVQQSFSDDLIDEGLKKTKIYKIITDQAFYRKRLSFIRDKLADLPDSKLSEVQRDLLKKFDSVLHQGNLMPRSDAIRFEQNKELRAELRSFFKGQKSQRKVLENFKVRLVRKLGDGIKEKSQYLNTVKAVLWGQTIGAGIGIVVGTALLPFTENDYIYYYTSSFQNWLNDLLLVSPLKTTLAMHNCAKQNRKFSVENVCLSSFLYSHLSSKLYKSRIDDNYNYLEDPEYHNRREELTGIFLKRRDRLNLSKFFTDNMDYVKEEGYIHYTAITFLELIDINDKQLSKGSLNKEEKESIYNYLTGNFKENEQENLITKISKESGTDLAKLVKEIKIELPSFASQIRETGSVSEDIKKFIDRNGK